MSKATIRWIKIFENREAIENCIPPKRTWKITADRKEICLVNSGTDFYAVDDKCPHQGASLSHGYCSEMNSIVCPLHRYHFDLKTGRPISGLCDRILTYPLKFEDTGVYLGIEDKSWSWW